MPNNGLLPNVLCLQKSDKFVFGLMEKELKSEKKMIVSTWNVHGASPAKVDTILTEQNQEVVCVQEMFLTSADDLNTENYNWYSLAKPWAKNVAIVVKKSADIKVENFKALSESLCVGDVVCRDRTVKVISCYLPVPKDPKNEVLKSQLTEFIKSIPKDDLFVLAGDFNVHLNPTEENPEIEEQTPIKEKTTSSKEKKNPSEEKTTLSEEKQAPSEEKTTPPEDKTTPPVEKTISPEKKTIPSKENTEVIEDNTEFLQQLANETCLCMEHTLYNDWNKYRNYLSSKVSPTHVSRPHQILMPKIQKLRKVTKLYTRWIPFFDNAILSLFLNDLDLTTQGLYIIPNLM